MKKVRIILFVVSVLAMLIAWLFIAYDSTLNLFGAKQIVIIVFLLVAGIIAMMGFLKRSKEREEGKPVDDELTSLIKYRTGYMAYMVSMYMWLFIFIMKSAFPDVETMLGAGILLSALIWYVSQYIVKREYSEK